MVTAPGLDSVDLAAAGRAEALLGALVGLHLGHWRQPPVLAAASERRTRPRDRRHHVCGGRFGCWVPPVRRLSRCGVRRRSPSGCVFGLCVEVRSMDIDGLPGAAAGRRLPWSATDVREPVEQVPPDVGVAHLAAAELDRDLDPVAVLQELDGAPDLGVEVALADLRPEPDLLELDRALVAPGFLLLAGLLVLELAVVEERVTGGLDMGATSTRSYPRSCASCRARGVGMTPSWLPSSSTTRTCGTRIISLTRRSLLRLVPHHCSIPSVRPARTRRTATTGAGRRRTIAHRPARPTRLTRSAGRRRDRPAPDRRHCPRARSCHRSARSRCPRRWPRRGRPGRRVPPGCRRRPSPIATLTGRPSTLMAT